MKNYIQSGDILTLVAPYDRLSGQGALIGGLFGVAAYDVLSGASGEFMTEGVFDLAKDTSTFASGDTVYWDNTAKKATSVTAGNTIIGGAVLANPDGTSALGGLTGDATVRVRVNDMVVGIVAYGNLDAAVLQEATVAITSANILGMNASPVSVLAAPGAGKAILVEGILFEMTRTSTAYANGGAVSFQYHTTTASVPHAGTIAASLVTTGGAGSAQTWLGPNVGTNGLVIPANEGIDITNATAAFITGTGTAKVFIKYRIVTL
jgi:predicted RecA/RadA family phage recombinase